MSAAPTGGSGGAANTPASADEPARLRGELEAALDALARQLDEVEAELDDGRRARTYLEINERTRGWRALNAYREARARLRARGSPAAAPEPARNGRRVASLPVRLDDGVAREAIRFAPARSPVVSVVVPVHGLEELTLRSLAALAARTPHELVEVVVVDDGSDRETAQALRQVEGIELVRNQWNEGFLDACRRGAEAASGEHLFFLNNDTEVQPGWLEPLLDAASDPAVGAVGSRLVYPDGTLQESGGAVWSDATAWNLGRDEHPEHPSFAHRRDVDYCSAASLLVRREAYERVGGFDRRFAPGYYEDTDLCFALRAAGYRVLVEPASVVLHHEGATHGTDRQNGAAAGAGKPLQRRNRHLFAVKWAAELARQQPSGTANGLLGGAAHTRPRILIADAWVPAPDRDSGSLRMTSIIRLLRELGCDVTLFPLNRERREPYTTELRRLGVEVHHGPWGLRDLVGRQAGLFDAVLLSRPNVAEALLEDLRRAFPRALVLYDTVDLHFVREERRRAVLGEGPDEVRTRRVELDAIRRSDVTVTVTEAEATHVRERVAGVRTLVLPNVHEVDAAAPLPFSSRRDLLFIGGFLHDPNVDAAHHLVEDVMPLLWRTAPDTRLWLVGSEPPASVRELASDRVVVTGYVPDPAHLFRRAHAFVAPLRYGAGMKGKIGHAMAFGLPVVTSPIGAEGMELVDGEHLLVRDSPDGLAAAVLELQRDETLWQRLASSSRRVVEERWSPEAMRERLAALVVEIAPARGRATAP